MCIYFQEKIRPKLMLVYVTMNKNFNNKCLHVPVLLSVITPIIKFITYSLIVSSMTRFLIGHVQPTCDTCVKWRTVGAQVGFA